MIATVQSRAASSLQPWLSSSTPRVCTGSATPSAVTPFPYGVNRQLLSKSGEHEGGARLQPQGQE